MKHRDSRILTTQVGSLARPQEAAQGLPRKPGGTTRSRDRRRFAAACLEIEGSAQDAVASPGRAQLQMVHGRDRLSRRGGA